MNTRALLTTAFLIGLMGCTNDNQTANRTNSPTPSTSPAPSIPGETKRNVPGTGTATTAAPTMTDADRALAQRVEDALRQDSTLVASAPNVQVYVNNGEVTLRGSVNSQEEKTNFAAKAQQVAGVTRVNNQLEVSSASR